MNNNRNNRRRGRGNRNQGGGGNQLNRIDSRARGNAPQLLDKYKKLAQDAQHNGDRVQAEYYLQFADHYFRVIADNKARQDEARAKRNETRGDGGDDNDARSDDGSDSDKGRENRRSNSRRQRSRKDDGGSSDYDETHDGELDSDDEPSGHGPDDDGEAAPKRRTRKPKSETPRKPRKSRKQENDESDAAIDSAVLPPSITGADATGDNGGDDTLEAVN